MEVAIRVPTQLRDLVGGAHRVVVDAAPPAGGGRVTVAGVLDALADLHPPLERRVRDETGRRRAHVNLFVGADNVRDHDDLDTAVAPGQELSIVPAVSGGCSVSPPVDASFLAHKPR